MDPEQAEFYHPRNLATRRRHRIESWWQIWFPLLLVVSLLAGGVYLLAASSPGSLGALAQVSTMLIAMPLLLIGLLLLLILGVAIYAVSYVIGWLPPLAFRIQSLAARIAAASRRTADLAAEPVLRLDSWAGVARHVIERFR